MKHSKFTESLRAVGGIEGIKKCLAVGNDAPLLIVLQDAMITISRLEEKLKRVSAVIKEVADFANEPECHDLGNN